MPVPLNWTQQVSEAKAKWQAARTSEETYKYLVDPPHYDFILTQRATSWAEVLSWLNELEGSWCFRGQRVADWLLTTSLDRQIRVEHEDEHSRGYYHLNRTTTERELLFRFRQQAQNYLTLLPAENDLISWLGIMQHYGVPTRLLDWTKSPFVALYFALEEAPTDKCAVWAINLEWLEAQANAWLQSRVGKIPEDLSARSDFVNSAVQQITTADNPVIIQIAPNRLDTRMVAQQSFFLCKLIDDASFAIILLGMLYHTDPLTSPVVRKLEIDKALRIDFLKRLRQMNIHRASLFPGLDGFGQSLKLDLEIKVAEAPR